ncbi:MAG: histidine kinase [Spirosomataceae bacterium]
MNRQPTISKSFGVEGLKNLQLQTFAGDIELLGHEENTIKVEVFATVRSIVSLFFVSEPVTSFDPEIFNFSMEVVGDSLNIYSKPNYFHPYNWVNFQNTSFRIYLPSTINSSTKTYGGNVSLKRLKGNHTFSTWGGNLYVESSEGTFRAKTMGGNVEIIRCKGDALLSTMGGRIYVLENEGDITVDTKGGNISVQKQNGKVHCSTWGGNIQAFDVVGEFECSTMGGNIRLQNMNGNIGASTKGGNITAEIPSVGQYAWFDTSGGNINLLLPLDSPLDFELSANKIKHPYFNSFSGYITKQEIRGKLNGGGAHITARTGGGKIRLDYATSTPITASPITPKQPTPQKETLATIAENPTNKQKTIKTDIKPKPIKSESTQTLSSKFDTDNLIITFLFSLLLNYGLNGIVYFTFELINPQSPIAVIYKAIFFSNIANTLGVVAAFYTFTYTAENRVYSNWAKYLILIAFTAIYVNIFQVFVWIGYWQHVDRRLISGNQNNVSFFYSILPYIVSCAYYYYWQQTRNITRKISEQEYQLLNLEKLKSKAQLDALEARINPHFLYNSLNSIAGLIHENPDKAEEMTIQLSKLFRYTTGRTEESFHTIANELEVIKSYLAIEQVRFGKRLRYEIDCEEGVLNTKIPRFLLQPLVENAIKHGISKIAVDGEITVKISQFLDDIVIKIHDNGPVFDEFLGGGFGLRSIREKLKIVYGDKATFEIQNEPDKAVIITVPNK